jgi:hypothetical protein
LTQRKGVAIQTHDVRGIGSASTYFSSSFSQPPIHATLNFAGSIGVPESHSATPPTRELCLDPVTFRPVSISHSSNHLPISSMVDPDTASPTSILSQNNVTPEGSSASNRASISSSIASDYSTAVSQPSSRSASSTSTTPWTWPIAEAVASRRAVLVPRLPAEVAETLSRRAWGDLPRQAIVVPIWAYEGVNSNAALPQAVLVLGVNPRRPYDKDYEEWVDLFRISLGVSLAAVLSWEAEVQRAECVYWIFSCGDADERCLDTGNWQNLTRPRPRSSAMFRMN